MIKNIYIYSYIYTYTHIHLHIYVYIHTYTHTHTHMDITYIHIYTHIHIGTYIYTHISTFRTICNLFRESPENPHTQIPHQVATSHLNRNKSQIAGFHKMRNTRARKPRTEFSNKSQ